MAVKELFSVIKDVHIWHVNVEHSFVTIVDQNGKYLIAVLEI